MKRSDERPWVTVLGAGNWGTTVAQLVARKGHRVTLWCRRKEQAQEINRRRTNEKYLPGVTLLPEIVATHTLPEAVEGVALLLLIVPTKSFRQVCRQMGDVLTPDQFVVHGSKGFEAHTHRRMSQVMAEETCIKQMGVLSGPNIAPEIAAGKPAGTVIASPFPQVVAAATRALSFDRFKIYHGTDVAGVEIAGALKNVVAIAAGVAAQLELGENARSLLITRGMAEIRRIGAAMGARPETFGGVAGLGDLIVTCASPLSRNNRVGAALARGEKLPAIVESLGMVAEGVNTARVVHEVVAAGKVDAPIFEAVYRVLYEDESPEAALAGLMALEPKPDVD
jgi:glycerol-3-phosphate dehydrogenase (NAD(P)+)